MPAYLNPESIEKEVYGWLPSHLSRYAVRRLLGARTKIMQVKYCPSSEPQKRSAAFQLLIQKQLTDRDISSHSHPEWLAEQSYRLAEPDEVGRQLKIFDLYEYATLAIYFCCDDDFRELRSEKNCAEMMDELYKALIFVDDPYAYYQQHAVFHTISEQALRCCLYLESEISSDDVFESQKTIAGFEASETAFLSPLLGQPLTALDIDEKNKQIALYFKGIWGWDVSSLTLECEQVSANLNLQWKHHGQTKKTDL